MSNRILLVEDEEHLLKVIKMNLEMDGYKVNSAKTGKEALEKFEQNRYDLIVLDVMLPEINGFEVCETIRLKNTRIPILFLTAKGNSQDRITGLKIGGDDYLVKPFNLEEFLLRVQRLLKRSTTDSNDSTIEGEYRFGSNIINFGTYEIKGVAGKHQLTDKEIRLLKLLIGRKGKVVSRNEILDRIWGYDANPSSRTIDNFVLNFRKYFERDQKNPVYFHSVRGVGYKFTS